MACKSIIISDETKQRIRNRGENLGIPIPEVEISLKPDQWSRILGQTVLVILILGRWLLPKGDLSRDQFSQLMLVYIGNAADIVEIFEAFRESKVMLEPTLTYVVLAIWSWSLMQFCLVMKGNLLYHLHDWSLPMLVMLAMLAMLAVIFEPPCV